MFLFQPNTCLLALSLSRLLQIQSFSIFLYLSRPKKSDSTMCIQVIIGVSKNARSIPFVIASNIWHIRNTFTYMYLHFTHAQRSLIATKLLPIRMVLWSHIGTQNILPFLGCSVPLEHETHSHIFFSSKHNKQTAVRTMDTQLLAVWSFAVWTRSAARFSKDWVLHFAN